MRKFIVLSLVASPALAAQSDQFDIATTLGSLLFVIAIIIGMAWLLKRTPLTQEELESVPFSNTLTQLLKKNDKNTPV